MVGKERIWTLAYADDLVILAKSEEGMEEMLKRMEIFEEEKVTTKHRKIQNGLL